MHYVMILLYTHIRILEKKGFLNVPHKDFGCSNDHFVNEFSTAASHLFFCYHFLYDVVTTVFGLGWFGLALGWVSFGFGCVGFVLGWLWLGFAVA